MKSGAFLKKNQAQKEKAKLIQNRKTIINIFHYKLYEKQLQIYNARNTKR